MKRNPADGFVLVAEYGDPLNIDTISREKEVRGEQTGSTTSSGKLMALVAQARDWSRAF